MGRTGVAVAQRRRGRRRGASAAAACTASQAAGPSSMSALRSGARAACARSGSCGEGELAEQQRVVAVAQGRPRRRRRARARRPTGGRGRGAVLGAASSPDATYAHAGSRSARVGARPVRYPHSARPDRAAPWSARQVRYAHSARHRRSRLARGANFGGLATTRGMGSLFDAVARIAGRQHGRISHAQLLAAGVDRDRIKRWRADGRLRPVAPPGVRRRAHRDRRRSPTSWPRCSRAATAPVRATGRSLHARGIVRERPPKPEVSVPYARRAPPAAHRGAPRVSFAAGRHDDLRADRDDDGAARAARRRALARAVRALPRVPRGMGPLSRDAGADRGMHRTQPDEAGRREAAPGATARTPRSASSRRASSPCSTVTACPGRARTSIIAGDKVDCHWPHHDLTIELHSYRFHGTRCGFETDNTRRRRSHHLAVHVGRRVRAR